MSTLIRPNPMSFMCLLITHGWFTGIRSRLGRDGIRILESGLAGRIFRLGLALELAGSEALAGGGGIGDLIGTTITRSITTAGTTRGAERFTTATITTAEEQDGAESGAAAQPTERAAGFTTIRAKPPDPLRATVRRPADMRRLAGRAVYDRARSAATIMVESRGAIRPEDEPAWAAAGTAEERHGEAAARTVVAGGVDGRLHIVIADHDF